ncbi:MAG: hypothetical protein IKS07_00410 [Lachnospiraceae bacterium]|nr:hypothetical protein [Lachnospiraceae bacterium]
MEHLQRQNKIKKLLCALLILGSVLAALKLIFVGFCQDEEYQIVMAYRRVMGDRMFADMWEPHQMSSFLNAAFIRIFLLFTGSATGIVVYLRVMGTLLQLLITLLFYFTLKKTTEKETAFLHSLFWFNCSMGLFVSAEYSSMMLWFSTLSILFLQNARLADPRGRSHVLFFLLSDIALCLCVLSYPVMAVFALLLWIFTALDTPPALRKKTMLLLILPCVIIGAAYVLFHAAAVSFPVFFETLPRIFLQDPTHQVSENSFWSEKLLHAARDLAVDGALALGALGVSALLLRKKTMAEKLAFASLLSLLMVCGQWLLFHKGYENGHIHTLVSAAGFFLLCRVHRGKDRSLCRLFFSGGAVMVLGEWALSNMSFDDKLSFGPLIHIAFLLLLCPALVKEDRKRLFTVTAVIWIFFLIFAKGFLLRSGREVNNITALENICRTGPAKGILTDYMNAYIMDADYEDWGRFVREGDRVLIVSENLHSNIYISYLFEDVTISDCAVNNPHDYGRRLLEYWERYPERAPSVIVTDCWYGQELISPDEWIMDYIKKDFGYTEVQDGRYLRFYRK